MSDTEVIAPARRGRPKKFADGTPPVEAPAVETAPPPRDDGWLDIGEPPGSISTEQPFDGKVVRVSDDKMFDKALWKWTREFRAGAWRLKGYWQRQLGGPLGFEPTLWKATANQWNPHDGI